MNLQSMGIPGEKLVKHNVFYMKRGTAIRLQEGRLESVTIFDASQDEIQPPEFLLIDGGGQRAREGRPFFARRLYCCRRRVSQLEKVVKTESDTIGDGNANNLAVRLEKLSLLVHTTLLGRPLTPPPSPRDLKLSSFGNQSLHPGDSKIVAMN
ncbi:hypothetical protein NM688_g3467 [Phlebia brevispora]|uniref:Uncharacterized protein n=1 Tax=Phlebia brevispora TaxID=194682 RepID=A0ACC1T5G2_9APHY|nr:hypothetical protein NM688_g3467 [Phlebia brevispora]